MQRSAQRAGVQRSGQAQCGIGVGVHKGVHLRLARFNAVQAGTQQIDGPYFTPRQALSSLPGIELVKGNRVRRVGESGHARQYVTAHRLQLVHALLPPCQGRPGLRREVPALRSACVKRLPSRCSMSGTCPSNSPSA